MNITFKNALISLLFAGSLNALSPAPGFAQEGSPIITIKDHKFVPAELIVPADKKIKLVIENDDATPEEFESYDLNREKIIGGKSSSTLYVGPLKPGIYKYFGEFHQNTAQGTIVAQ